MQEEHATQPIAQSSAELTLPPSFPAGDYTPFGYIDNPAHTMVHNRSGVIRSVPPLGFGWWCRRFKGAYGTGTIGHLNYLSILKMSLAWDDVRLVSAPDYEQAGIPLVSKYHSKHMVSYDFEHDALQFSFRYFLADEHTLACLVDVSNLGQKIRDVCLHANHVYGLWEQPWWGADSIGMRYIADLDAGVSTVSAYGDYFALGATVPAAAHKASACREEVPQWLRGNDLSSLDSRTTRGAGPLHTIMTYKLSVPVGGRASALVALCRGVNELAALRRLQTARAEAVTTLEQQLDEDEAFWSHCPQLDGDWPTVWKHGWVYDWETLRMNVRRPVGIFAHHWDAMQVHSPRSVLGEASVDMFALSHADLELAKDVMLGTFADAPLPNVPCCREDGSMNMVAADGEACGTAPCWCFPFKVLRAIYARSGDADWMAELYPYLRAYIDWWLAQRSDEHGWLHCKCDWESGQDGSKRFPESEGAEAGFVRTVDVEASMVEALRNMALFAEIAGAPLDVPRWRELAEHKAATTRKMFVDGWYRDFDTRSGEPILLDYLDVMMLTPLTCQVASDEQIAALRDKFEHFRQNPRHWLEWPSFFLAFTEAAWTAGLRRLAGEATADIADRIYPRTDAREPLFYEPEKPFVYRVPGVACEYWPLAAETEPGGENYGWGATLPLHVIRSIVGFRETEDVAARAFLLAPALPARLMQPGRRYGLRNLTYRDMDLTVSYFVESNEQLDARVEYATTHDVYVTISDATGNTVAEQNDEARRGTLTFRARNGEVYTLRFAAREL